MKQLTCEMCGCADLLKQEGVFICQHCGTKYSVEEAKKMMAEDTVAVTGTDKVDNSAQIQNYLVMANNAYKGGNLKEAEDYANKVIEIDAENAEVWFIKGWAAGWQSTFANNRFNESLGCWQKAIQFCAEEEKEKYKKLASEEMQKLMIAMVSKRAKNFGSHPSKDNAQGIVSTLQSNTSLVFNFLLQAGFVASGGTPELSDEANGQIAKLMNDAAIAGGNKADKDYGPEKSNRHQFAYRTYLERMGNCVVIMELAMGYARTEAAIRQIYENYVALQNKMINSCSWSFDASSRASDHYAKDTSLTNDAIAALRKEIAETEKKCDEMIQKNNEKMEKDRKAAVDKYWANHNEEKEALDAEKAQLAGKIEHLNARLAAIPGKAEVARIKAEISKLEGEKNGLGVFKGKEKKVLQEGIESLQSDLQNASGKVNASASPLVEELNAAKRRVAEIDDRLLNAK